MAQTKPIKLVECAFNQYAKITKCLGYCKKHKCYLTKSNIENMNCITKGCFHLVKLKHPYWNEMKLIQGKAKQKKDFKRKLYETK